MGNASQRMARKPSARVMRPDGIIVEYDYRIQVAMLMTLHPDHLVIHCSTDTADPGEPRKMKVMDLEDRLRLGQSYIMYPIPLQYKEMFNAPPVQTEGVSGSRSLNLKLTLARLTKSATLKGARRRLFERSSPSRIPLRATSVSDEVKVDGGWVEFDTNRRIFNLTSKTEVEKQKLELAADS